MPQLAAAGYHVFAPDLRGYGRTGGTEVTFDDDLSPFRTFNRVTDMVALVSAFGYRTMAGVVGHDVGSGIAGWCGVVRPDIFRSVVMMSAPFGGPPALPFGTADKPAVRAGRRRRHDLRRSRALESAAEALPALLLDPRGQQQHVAARRRACTRFCALTTT